MHGNQKLELKQKKKKGVGVGGGGVVVVPNQSSSSSLQTSWNAGGKCDTEKSRHGEDNQTEDGHLLLLCSRSHGLLQHLTVTARLHF